MSAPVTVTRWYEDGSTSTFEADDINELRPVVAEDARGSRSVLYFVATAEDARRLGGVKEGVGPWVCGWPEVHAVLWVDGEVTP